MFSKRRLKYIHDAFTRFIDVCLPGTCWEPALDPGLIWHWNHFRWGALSSKRRSVKSLFPCILEASSGVWAFIWMSPRGGVSVMTQWDTASGQTRDLRERLSSWDGLWNPTFSSWRRYWRRQQAAVQTVAPEPWPRIRIHLNLCVSSSLWRNAKWECQSENNEIWCSNLLFGSKCFT